MYPVASDRLRGVKTFLQLTAYLREELDWPLNEYVFDQLTFEYQPTELGLKDLDAAQATIHQLRPLVAGQPWGIFFIEFDKKRLPVVVLRRILSHLVIKKRGSANRAERAAWNAGDLLFISAFGNVATDDREIAFAHFHQESGDLPTLHVLGWDGGNTSLTLASIEHTLRTRLCWPKDSSDGEAWRKQWSGAFRHRIGHIVHTATKLAKVLAMLAGGIRDRAKTMLSAENDNGPLTKLFRSFQTALLHELTPDTFADTYAQSITYGLLTAAFSRSEMNRSGNSAVLLANNVTDNVPVTNPFLKEMLETFLKIGGRKEGIDFDELGIQDVVELLRSDETDLRAIIEDFGNKNSDKDPVIHFYEDFLSAYNKHLRIQRGVFYTPQPVVSYIVRSVHELLQTQFGLEDGLASITTWGEMAAKHTGLKIPDKVKSADPFVVILDPATGTGTFLVETIEVIHSTLTAKWKQQRLTESQQRAAWNAYVPKHLLPRLYGYELMMAPYAISHMKLPLKLKETGFTAWDRLGDNDRVRIYLTNTLEPGSENNQQGEFDEWTPALAHEAQAVDKVKCYQCFTVIIGNPPYAGHSSNKEARFIVEKVRDYKRGVAELQKPGQGKWLQDDYVKFIRFAQCELTTSGIGVLGYITNHSFIDNPTFRGMRSVLLNCFSSIHIIDLHGNAKKREASPDGSPDENVFDILQGVCITLAAKTTGQKSSIWHADLFGPRSAKYYTLAEKSLRETDWQLVAAEPSLYLYRPQNATLRMEYEAFTPLASLMGMNGSPAPGIVTTQDEFAISWSKNEAISKVNALLKTQTEAEARQLFRLCGQNQWSYTRAKVELPRQSWQDELGKVLYRPFDLRWTVYNANVAVHRRLRATRHFLGIKNIGLCVGKAGQVVGSGEWNLVSCTRYPADLNLFYRGGACIFPLHLLSEEKGLKLQRDSIVNFPPQVLEAFASKLGRLGGFPIEAKLTPENVFNYFYSILHSPGYRSRYSEFLKVDFPRLPFTGDTELFHALVHLGGELVSLHLMESPKLDKTFISYTGPANPKVERTSYVRGTVWLDEAQTCGFYCVPETVWNFHIGGYQVCEKWLKDRRGRTLSSDDIAHYYHIAAALSRTIEIMVEIDFTIEKYGGWPGAFSDETVFPVKVLGLKPKRELVKLHPAL